MRNKNEIEEIEDREKLQNITVQLLNIAGDVKQYDDVKFIKIRFRSSVGLKRWTVNPKWFSTSTVRICSKSR